MSKADSTLPWNREFYRRSPMFTPLVRRALQFQQFEQDWPTLKAYQEALNSSTNSLCNMNGGKITVVPHAVKTGEFGNRYEPRIYLEGELQIRSENWHDYFNLLVWMTFPKSKALLNARHFVESKLADSQSNRNASQDLLTLFDESGVIVVSSSVELTSLLREHQWKELFWSCRQRVREEMRFYLFGHALYEKALRPFIGITGRCVFLAKDQPFFAKGLEEQIGILDENVSEYISAIDPAQSSATIPPLPLLGVPGWCAENEIVSYYENETHFRKKRTNTVP